VAIAFVVGVAAAIPFFLATQDWPFAVMFAAGVVLAILVRDQRAGMRGLLLGVAVAFAVWGAIVIAQKLLSCASVDCSGMSSPGFTVALVVGLALLGQLAAAAGFALGAIGRAIAARLLALRT
jgi:hypothetical protein